MGIQLIWYRGKYFKEWNKFNKNFKKEELKMKNLKNKNEVFTEKLKLL